MDQAKAFTEQFIDQKTLVSQIKNGIFGSYTKLVSNPEFIVVEGKRKAKLSLCVPTDSTKTRRVPILVAGGPDGFWWYNKRSVEYFSTILNQSKSAESYRFAPLDDEPDSRYEDGDGTLTEDL